MDLGETETGHNTLETSTIVKISQFCDSQVRLWLAQTKWILYIHHVRSQSVEEPTR